MLNKTARDIMNPHVQTADRKEILFDVTTRMAQHNVGAVVVTSEGQPVGIFSERDLLKRVSYRDISLHSCHVGEVMTPKVSSVSADEAVEDVNDQMRRYNHCHLAVKDGGQIVGMISLRDLLDAYTAHGGGEEVPAG